MKAAVIDASVVVRWVVPEDHSEAAVRLLTDGIELHVPGHWFAEAGTTLWAKSAVHGVLTCQQAVARGSVNLLSMKHLSAALLSWHRTLRSICI